MTRFLFEGRSKPRTICGGAWQSLWRPRWYSSAAAGYTSGGLVTYFLATNNILAEGANTNVSLKLTGCTFKSLAPYVPSAARMSIALGNARIIDDGSNFFQNAVETLTYPAAQLVSLGAKNGPWVVTTPAVAAVGTPGAFAATCSMHTLQLGKWVQVQAIVTITNIGTATGFSVPFPVTPKMALFIAGSADNVLAYNWFSATGQIFKFDATATP
jgi:hypothetical protein